MKKILINLALFQVGWLVCVLGGDLYALGYIVAALLVHSRFVMSNPIEWQLIAVVTVVGCLWDVLMAKTGMITYAEVLPIGIPLWLVCLWILFATTFMHGLSWLYRYPVVGVIFAAVLGPASYWFGASLSDAALGAPLFAALAVMALGWGLLFPCGIYYAGRINHRIQEAK